MTESFAHSPERLLELLAREDLWLEPGGTVTVTGDATSGWTVEATNPVDSTQVPAMYARFVPSSVKVFQHINIPAPAQSGTATYRGGAAGTPAEVAADLVVSPALSGGSAAGGSVLTVNARFSVKVPILGSALESKAEPFARNLLAWKFKQLTKF